MEKEQVQDQAQKHRKKLDGIYLNLIEFSLWKAFFVIELSLYYFWDFLIK